jgi:hypothetical protein
MKNTKHIFFLLSFSFVLVTSQAQVIHPDTMVHKIFVALKNRDEKAFVALYPNKEQMLKLFSRIMSGLTVELAKMDTTNKQDVSPEELNKLMLEKMKEKMSGEEIDKEYRKVARNFNQLIEQGQQKGIEWKKIVLSRYTYDTARLKDDAAIKFFGSDEVKSMKGVIYFKSGADAYQVSFKEIMFLPDEGGWYGGELHSLKKQESQTEKTTPKKVPANRKTGYTRKS